MDCVEETLRRPLMGVRVFRLLEGWLAGISMYGDYFRPDEPRRAECRAEHVRAARYDPHEPPGGECMCGYYAFYTLDSATRDEILSGDITGVVSAWGDVELHERGFRSEWMMPEAIVLRDGDPPATFQKIAHAYAVPLISEGGVDSFCRKRGEVMDPLEPVDAAQIQAETFQNIQRHLVEIHRKWAEQIKPILAQMKHPDGANGEARRKPPTNFQEAIERKRNKPAFWRDAAGGDVYDGS